MARVIYREDRWGQGFLVASLLHWIIIFLLLWGWISYQRSTTDAQDKFCLIIDKSPTVFKVQGQDRVIVKTKIKTRTIKVPVVVPQSKPPAPKPKPVVKPKPKPKPAPKPVDTIAKSDYLNELLYRIEVEREYPSQSVRYGEEGVVGLRFNIQPSGEITNVSVGRSSGYPRLDQAAVMAVHRVSPYDKIPDVYIQELRQQGRSFYPVSVNIEYTLGKTR